MRGIVLILVLVDLTFKLILFYLFYSFYLFSLNPCFSGLNFQTYMNITYIIWLNTVLILVLVDLTFKLKTVIEVSFIVKVLILVLVDLTFKHKPTRSTIPNGAES